MNGSGPLRLDWIGQPDELTCGPTCLAMLHGGIASRHGFEGFVDVASIAAMCATDATNGTTHEGMAVGVRGLGLAAKTCFGRDAFARAWDSALAEDKPLLLRTLTRCVPHWIVALPIQSGAEILDPWLGRLRLDMAAIETSVSPRGYETWTVDHEVRPRALRVVSAVHFKEEAVCLMAGEFQRLMDEDLAQYLDTVVDWHLSRALLVDDRVVGAYLLSEREATSLAGVDLPEGLEGLRPVEGVALALDPSERGNGYGRLLRDLPRALGFEMVWGQQHKALGNLQHWLRHRRLIGDTGESWVTAAALGEAPIPALRL